MNRKNNVIDFERIERGEILYADLKEQEGSVQSGERPVLVIQNDTGNKYSPTIIVASVTRQNKKKGFPTHKKILKKDYNFLSGDSVIICEQIHTISKQQIINRWGKISDEDMNEVDEKIMISLALKKRA